MNITTDMSDTSGIAISFRGIAKAALYVADIPYFLFKVQ